MLSLISLNMKFILKYYQIKAKLKKLGEFWEMYNLWCKTINEVTMITYNELKNK